MMAIRERKCQVQNISKRYDIRLNVVVCIWRQFPYDLFENMPNHHSSQEGSYLLLSVQQ
jgi:hypothetical protein